MTDLCRLVAAGTSALAVLALASLARSDVRVVNPAPGSGAPYTTIQAAVNAGVDGDVILVKPWSNYAGFTVLDKALTIVGDPGTNPLPRVVGTVHVLSLGTTRTLVIAKLRLEPPAQGTPVTALNIANDDGQVRIQQCTIAGAQGTWVDDPSDPGGYGMGSPGGHGVEISNCAGGIAFGDCTLSGGWGGMVGGTGASDGGHGGDGVHATSARVVLYDCSVRGGRGGDGSYVGGDAGLGMLSDTGASPNALFASNTTFLGGNGGIAEDLGCFNCGPGGDGGDGLRVQAGSLFVSLGCTFTGGFGALGHPTSGTNGQGLVNNGTMVPLAPSRVKLSAPTLVRAATTMTLTVNADPGDSIFLFRSTRTTFLGLVSWRGFWLAKPLGPTPETKPPTPFVVVPGSGQVSVNIAAPYLEPGQQERTEFFQAYRVTPSGSLTLGSFVPVTVVAPGF